MYLCANKSTCLIAKGLKHFIITVLALLAGTHFLWAQAINGRVVDAETGEPMPGVAIQYNQSLNRGIVTDLDGNFRIPERRLIQKVVFRFIGYHTLEFLEEEVPKTKLWVVELSPEAETLEEVEVLAGENPALRIIRNAIANRNANNPRKYESYTYVSYNKDVITYKMELPDSALSHRDSVLFERDTAKAKDRHMFVIESVTRKLYKAPKSSKETVVGTKISGFKHPSVAAIPDGIQNFGFHENIIPLVSKKFLNPLADGADKKYVYILKDTLYEAPKDTIFIIDYFPEQGANFEGFEGEMHIHTRKWALVKVKAHPFDKGKVNLSMEQDYQWVQNSYWFPKNLNFDFELEKVPFRKTGAIMHGKTYLDSVQVGIEIPDDRFSHIEVDLDKKAGYVSDEFWQQYRKEGLTVKEQETYRQMDSVGDRYNFDAALDATRHIYDGYIAVGALDVELTKLVAYNDYEGLRLGMGLYTNELISEKFQLGGYVGHGARDKQWKYGGKFRWYFDKPNDFYVTAAYSKDVLDPGGIRLKYREWSSFSQQFFNVLMDRVEQASIDVSYRVGRYSWFKTGVRHFAVRPTYEYQFSGPDRNDVDDNIYRFTEARIWYRWQYKEKYSRNYGQRISMGSKWPIVNMIYSRGLDGTLNGQFTYNKIELGIFWIKYFKNLGKLRVSAEVGLVDRALPWSMNFSGRPSFNPSFSVVVRETFQTMRFNEFSSDRYFAFFFMHDFGPLLLRYKSFKPEIRIAQAISYGTLSNPEYHQGVPFKTLEDGFFESGLIIDNLLRINMFNVGYFGLGAGVFYRYGANHLPNEADNWTFKIAFMYSVN
jgi:hypothetical protein